MLKDMITKAKAKKAAKAYLDLMEAYQSHITELQEQREEWRKMSQDPAVGERSRALARYQVLEINERITQLVAERSEVMMRSF